MPAIRRPLTFATLGEVMPEVDRLLAGPTTVGRWSLAQICRHLELAIRLSMDGVPRKAPWVVRRTAGPAVRWLSFRLGWIPEGVPMYQVYLPQPGPDAAHESEALRAAIVRFGSFTGRFDEHPLFGWQSPTQWERFHCLHCAHHLSFVLPMRSKVVPPTS
jgi:hypothetical protein